MKRQLISMAVYGEQQQQQIKESKKKSKCTEEVCTHRKHKKKRKHKRHSADKGAADDNAVSSSSSVVQQESRTIDEVKDKFSALETEEDTETMDSYRDDPDFQAGPSSSQVRNGDLYLKKTID